MAQTPVINVLPAVAQICRECPMGIMVQAYVRAARQFCNKSRWLVLNVPGATVIGQPLYSLGSDTYHEIIGIQAMSITESVNDTHPLTEAGSSGWPAGADDDVSDFYQYVPEGQFALHPAPNLVYALSVNVFVQPKRGVTSLEASLLVNWGHALEMGALAYLLDLPRTPWTDKTEANKQFLLFRAEMNQAHSSALRGYNAGALTTGRLGNTSAGLRVRMQPI